MLVVKGVGVCVRVHVCACAWWAVIHFGLTSV